MKLHFAGADGSIGYQEILLRNYNIVNRLESYYSLGNRKPNIESNLLLDSGGFVARTKGTPININKYIEYLNKNEIKMAFNLDTNDIEETLKNQELLKKETNTYIIPVYHDNEHFLIEDGIIHGRNKNYEWLLQHYIDNFPYISIGGLVGKIRSEHISVLLDDVFSKTKDKIRIHGLGCSSQKLLEKYPFYSVDSTSWLAPAKFGRFLSNIDKISQIWFSKNYKDVENLEIDIEFWINLENYITELWKIKGVIWDDFKPEEYI